MVAPYIIAIKTKIPVFLYSKVLCSTLIVFGSGKINFNPEKNNPA